MYRAQGIKKRWELEKAKDTDTSKVAPLEYLIDLEYIKYKELCYWCCEMPKTKGQWLLQKIDVSV